MHGFLALHDESAIKASGSLARRLTIFAALNGRRAVRACIPQINGQQEVASKSAVLRMRTWPSVSARRDVDRVVAITIPDVDVVAVAVGRRHAAGSDVLRAIVGHADFREVADVVDDFGHRHVEVDVLVVAYVARNISALTRQIHPKAIQSRQDPGLGDALCWWLL